MINREIDGQDHAPPPTRSHARRRTRARRLDQCHGCLRWRLRRAL